jgi:hypothetical protein
MDSICRKYGEMEGGFKFSNLKQKKNFKIMILTDPLLSYSAINHLTQWKAVRHGSLHAKAGGPIARGVDIHRECRRADKLFLL